MIEEATMRRARHGAYFATLMALLFLAANCTTFDNKRRNCPEPCYGVWINSIYNSQQKRAAKIIYYPDMTWAAYTLDSSTRPMWRGTISIIDKRTDQEGNTWYKVTTSQLGYNIIVYELWRMNPTGEILEGVWGIGSIPRELDPDDQSYTIYYKCGSSPQNAHDTTIAAINVIQ
jgi:hypothetical protein